MGTYIRLVDINDAKGKESAFLSAIQDKNSSIRFETSAENFSKIPGSPVAYWVRKNVYSVFQTGIPVQQILEPKQGMSTCNNNRFVRIWYEVQYDKFALPVWLIAHILSQKGLSLLIQ